MDFVCRLMEEYGISYYFKHSDGEHKLIMTDEMSTFEAIPGGSRWYLPTARERHSDKDYFFSWSPARSFTSGKIKLDDYDFKKSDQRSRRSPKTIRPAFRSGHARGVRLSGPLRRERATVRRSRRRGATWNGPTTIISTPKASASAASRERWSHSRTRAKAVSTASICALRCVHRYANQAYRSGAGTSEIPYEGNYEFVKSDKTYAPPRLTPKAVVQGPQTAKVVGEGEIDVDEYGRILVRFHWDQEQDQSRRCRVAQVWAGKQWGGIYTPRVGMEALVQFLEGDPDQPLVVGCVYNDKHMPPYALPGDKSISGVKSNSTPGGNGFNEFIFDDKDGSELVRLHAQKDLESVVENDESRNVKKDRKTEIGQNDTLNVIQVLKIDAGTKVEITCGGSKITMTPDKIKIESLAGGNRAQPTSRATPSCPPTRPQA